MVIETCLQISHIYIEESAFLFSYFTCFFFNNLHIDFRLTFSRSGSSHLATPSLPTHHCLRNQTLPIKMSQSQAQPLSPCKLARTPSQNTVVLSNLSYPSRPHSHVSWSRTSRFTVSLTSFLFSLGLTLPLHPFFVSRKISTPILIRPWA